MNKATQCGSTQATRIGVWPDAAFRQMNHLWTSIANAFDLEVVAGEPNITHTLDALVLIDPDRHRALEVAEQGVPCLCFLPSAAHPSTGLPREIELGAQRELVGPLTGLRLTDPEGNQPRAVNVEVGDEVVALSGGEPFWVRSRLPNGTSAQFVTMPLPDLAAGEPVCLHLIAQRFARLLPLVAFLRSLPPRGWREPQPLRACIVLDDPSLASMTYGCLDFEELARTTEAHRFHAAVATIPLDVVRARKDVTRLFGTHRDRISIAAHGNDHTRLELGRPRSEAEALSLLSQALNRMSVLESSHGVPVCRVMEPPYGTVSQTVLAPLNSVGYEGVLMSVNNYLRANPAVTTPPGFGLRTAEASPEGLAILPRRMIGRGSPTEIALGVLLGQPVILAGHHYDASNGFSRILGLVEFANRLAPLEWSSLGAISRANYQIRRSKELLGVRACSRSIRLTVPPGVDHLSIERPWAEPNEGAICRVDGMPAPTPTPHSGRAFPLAVKPGSHVEILSPAARPSAQPAAMNGTAAWPRVRRRLMELRDRMYPILPSPLRKPIDALADRGTQTPR